MDRSFSPILLTGKSGRPVFLTKLLTEGGGSFRLATIYISGYGAVEWAMAEVIEFHGVSLALPKGANHSDVV